MKYRPGQKVMYKNYKSEVVFCYENYKGGKNAYAVKFKRGGRELHRLCYEGELDEPAQMELCHEYIFLLSKSQRYYYNSEAILEPYTTKPPKKLRDKHAEGYQADYPRGERFSPGERDYYSRGGKNKRTVWTIPVKKPKSTNYATFPTDIAKTCILAGCPDYGIVLDAFGGTGTTAEVAKDLHRNCICVELKAESAKIAYKRVCGE